MSESPEILLEHAESLLARRGAKGTRFAGEVRQIRTATGQVKIFAGSESSCVACTVTEMRSSSCDTPRACAPSRLT